MSLNKMYSNQSVNHAGSTCAGGVDFTQTVFLGRWLLATEIVRMEISYPMSGMRHVGLSLCPNVTHSIINRLLRKTHTDEVTRSLWQAKPKQQSTYFALIVRISFLLPIYFSKSGSKLGESVFHASSWTRVLYLAVDPRDLKGHSLTDQHKKWAELL